MKREEARRRAEVMAERWRCGDTLAAIGEDYGPSRQRVQQILRYYALATADDAARARRETRDRADDADRERMRSWLKANPGASRRQLSTAVQLPSARVSALLEEDMRRLLVTVTRRSPGGLTTRFSMAYAGPLQSLGSRSLERPTVGGLRSMVVLPAGGSGNGGGPGARPASPLDSRWARSSGPMTGGGRGG